MQTQINGYVLAGGRSSRMGCDKALIELAGKPLVQRAVETLSQVCDDVYILGSRLELSVFAPLVPDVHPDCGPLSGIEAALLHARSIWSLVLAVDMPFIPVDLLRTWTRDVVGTDNARVAMFTAGGKRQPTLCLLHRELAPFARQAIEQGQFKLSLVLDEASRILASQLGVTVDQVMVSRLAENVTWFANLNTPEEFAAAEQQFGDTFY